MKRVALVVLLGLGIVALASAQGWGRRTWSWVAPPVPQITSEIVTVTGDLTIVQGSLAVKSGNTTYFVSGLDRYIGFIEPLKEGATVTLLGAAITNSRDQTSKYLRATKLTIAGKDYEIAPPTIVATTNYPNWYPPNTRRPSNYPNWYTPPDTRRASNYPDWYTPPSSGRASNYPNWYTPPNTRRR